MSVPPLVSSTPPPPDICDDEFSFRYPDSDDLPPYDFAADETTVDLPRSPSPPKSAVDRGYLGFDAGTEPKDASGTEAVGEENNVEDLDLKLDGLQLTFHAGKDAVDESLSDSFDDFGTFLSSAGPSDVPDAQSPQSEESADPKDASSDLSAASDRPGLEEFDVVRLESKDAFEVRVSPFELRDDAVEMFRDNIATASIAAPIDLSYVETDAFEEVSKTECDKIDFEFPENPSNIVTTEVHNIFDDAVDPPDFQNSPVEFHAEFDCFQSSFINNGSDWDDKIVEPEKFDNASSIRDVDVQNVNCDDDFDEFTDFKTNDPKVELEINTFQKIDSADISLPVSTSEIDPDDDFGDFDTYAPIDGEQKQIDPSKSTDISSETVIFDQICSNVDVIFPDESNLNQNDDLSSDPKCELKLSLGENWSRLVNYEMEQSYLFPWNNSTSQKSLLKCLGIDSRNILFGSKWNTNMPRFAANLGISPLQPIKQKVSNEVLNEKHLEDQSNQDEGSSVKDVPWENEPQYEDGDFQASSYAESLLLDLEHLMATLDQMTSGQSAHFKISDLFTNACNERDDNLNIPHSIDISSLKSENLEEKINQPTSLNIGRKINLPETHIFTPTDSVTPWSHTIHYNDENLDPFPDLVSNSYRNPQTYNIDVNVKPQNSKIPTEAIDIGSDVSLSSFSWKKSDVKSDFKIEKNVSDEIDDFGDFQSATQESLNMSHNIPNTVENVLKPIKVSPDPPIVNWPSPGEVKTTYFDDFSNIKLDNFNDSRVAYPSLINSFDSQSFVLKESKISNETEVNIDPVSIDLTNRVHSIQCAENNVPKSTPNIQESLSLNTFLNEKSDQSIIDDFDDFKCAEFVPEKSVFSDSKPFQTSNAILPNSVNGINNSFNLPKENHQFSFAKPLNPTPIARPADESTSKNYAQQILQPLSLENYSHINWPNPGTDFQNLSKFNPVDSIKSYSENNNLNATNSSSANDRIADDDGWSDFVSIKPTNSDSGSKTTASQFFSNNGYGGSSNLSSSKENEDWSDFVCSVVPSKNSNELKTISHNIHNQPPNSSSYVTSFPSSKSTLQNNSSPNISTLPHLNYVSPKSNVNRNYASQFQNL